MKRTMLIGFVLCLSIGASISPAQAGGYPYIELDQWPLQAVAGQPLNIGFMMRYYDGSPNGYWDQFAIEAVHAETQTKVSSFATHESRKGHYVGTLILPQGGTWRWQIQAVDSNHFALAHPMPDLTVQASNTTLTPITPTYDALLSAWLLGGGAGVSALGSVWLFRRRRRFAFVVALLVVFACLLGLRFAAIAYAQTSSKATVQLGKELFLAKGCIVCHQQAAHTTARQQLDLAQYQPGRNLTNLSRDSAYLRVGLMGLPGSLCDKRFSGSCSMPSFKMTDNEVDALIAFLQAPTP